MPVPPKPPPPPRPAWPGDTVRPPHRQQVDTPPPSTPPERTKDLYKKLQEVEARAKESASVAITELTDVYERQLADRDGEIERLRAELGRQAEANLRADTTLREALEQVRGQTDRIEDRMVALVSSAVTAELSKRFASPDEVKELTTQGARASQIKTVATALLGAIVASGALTAIVQSCSAQPVGVQPSAVELSKPLPSAVPGHYGSR